MTILNGFYVVNGKRSDFHKIEKEIELKNLRKIQNEYRKKYKSVATEHNGKIWHNPEIFFVWTEKPDVVSKSKPTTNPDEQFTPTTKKINELIRLRSLA